MLVRIVVVAVTLLAIAVISVLAIVVSTSKGSDWGESVWKAIDESGDQGPGPES